MLKRIFIFSLVLLVSSVKGFSFDRKGNDPQVVNIPYGAESEVVYNLSSGTYEVFANKKK
ncbi:hypothetical protein [Pedobacter panaciterrae]